MPAPDQTAPADECPEGLRKLLLENAARLRLLRDPEYLAETLAQHPQLRGQLDDHQLLDWNKQVTAALESLASRLETDMPQPAAARNRVTGRTASQAEGAPPQGQ